MAFLLKTVSDNPAGCVFWPFNRNTQGYGLIWIDGRKQPAHRVVCKMRHGSPPTSLHQAAHNCGNGALGCMSPGCVRWATRSENEADKIAHGTSNRGQRSHLSKLSHDQVRSVILKVAERVPYTVIADEFSISAQTVGDIAKGRSWKHIDRHQVLLELQQ